MEIKNLAKALVAVAGLSLGSLAIAATGGGATIHNSATLTYSGGLKVSAQVDVQVKTVPTAPIMETLTALPVQAVAGQVVEIQYRVTSTSNGFDAYNMQIGQVANGASNLTYTIDPGAQVNLNSSFTSQASASGAVYIPAGSGKDFAGTSGDAFSAGDIVVISGYYYKVTSVVEGTVANTNLGTHTLTAEVPTRLNLEPANLSDNSYIAAPIIQPNTYPAGTQVGEAKVITVKFTAGNPNASGTNGTYDLTLEGTTGTTDDTTGTSVTFTNTTDTGAITVLSGDATLVKAARNKTTNPTGTFDTSGVTAKAGDIIEYRLTVSPATINSVTGAKLTDTLSGYVNYKAGSTTLNGVAVADAAGAVVFPLHTSLGGLEVTGTNGTTLNTTPGTIATGETAVVIFEVEVK